LSLSTKRIYQAHKLFDKTSGGYINGQELVVLLLVTAQITIPVGFAFYLPDPAQSDWKKQDKKLKKQGIPKKSRPTQPPKNDKYKSQTRTRPDSVGAFQSLSPRLLASK